MIQTTGELKLLIGSVNSHISEEIESQVQWKSLISITFKSVIGSNPSLSVLLVCFSRQGTS